MRRRPTRPRFGPAAAWALAWSVTAAPGVLAQDPPPTPEEREALAAAAEAAPLFATDAPLVMTLTTRIDWLRDDRPDEEEADGTITYLDGDAAPVTVDVEVRTRGNFRRSKRNCNFPPLRLDLPRSRVDGTVFAGQNRLKLVTPCHDSRDDYQQYVFKEYLAYRVLQLLTPFSFRVRLVDITYVDVEDEYETRTKTGFLIESDEAMAHRNGGTMMDLAQLHPAHADDRQSWVVALFQYMIGNTDWSGAFFHNVELVRTVDGRYMPVPYDFDFSGLVNARYATPPPQVNIRNVRQRAFRGFCRPTVDHGDLARQFQSIRDELGPLFRTVAGLEDRELERGLEYLDEFWEVLEDQGKYEREILRDCREMPGD
ncbi:MAG: hypothetical protein RJQ04_14485 [Longimicrobiales bacterium]